MKKRRKRGKRLKTVVAMVGGDGLMEVEVNEGVEREMWWEAHELAISWYLNQCVRAMKEIHNDEFSTLDRRDDGSFVDSELDYMMGEVCSKWIADRWSYEYQKLVDKAGNSV